MPKLPKKKEVKKERSVPYRPLTPAKPLTRSRTSVLNFSDHKKAFSDLEKLEALRKVLEEDDKTAGRRTVVTRQMTKNQENKAELENILNSPKMQKCIQERLTLSSTEVGEQSEHPTGPKATKTSSVKEKVSRKRSVSSRSVGKSPKKSNTNACVSTENQNGEVFVMEDCPMDADESIGDQGLNISVVLREARTGQIAGSKNVEILMNEERRDDGKYLEQCPYQTDEGGDLNDSSPVLRQAPTEKRSETHRESEAMRNVVNLAESENGLHNVEGSHCNQWKGYLTSFVGSVVQSTTSFLHNVFEDFLQG